MIPPEGPWGELFEEKKLIHRDTFRPLAKGKGTKQQTPMSEAENIAAGSVMSTEGMQTAVLTLELLGVYR